MKEVRQCSSCGGFCKKSGCERANITPPAPQRPWVGLTDEEMQRMAKRIQELERPWIGLTEERIEDIWLKWKDNEDDWANVLGLARLFEAEIKEKNNV
jgi:hypothetical protein